MSMNDFEKVQECFEILKKDYPNAIGRLGYLEIPIGWMQLVADCAKEIQKAIILLPKSKRDKFGAEQIKEKFGGLRWYPSCSNELTDPIIKKYEALSYKTCQVCGKKGKPVSEKGWISTLCVERAEHRIYFEE